MKNMGDEPILSKLDRLDNILRELEEIRSSSSPSTSVSSMDDLSPRSMCRPMSTVVVETEAKGSLIHRLVRLEDRVLKMEQELVVETSAQNKSKNKNKGRLKQLVKHCVHGTKNKPFF